MKSLNKNTENSPEFSCKKPQGNFVYCIWIYSWSSWSVLITQHSFNGRNKSINKIGLTERDTKDSGIVSHIKMLKHRFTKYLLPFRIHDMCQICPHSCFPTCKVPSPCRNHNQWVSALCLKLQEYGLEISCEMICGIINRFQMTIWRNSGLL